MRTTALLLLILLSACSRAGLPGTAPGAVTPPPTRAVSTPLPPSPTTAPAPTATPTAVPTPTPTATPSPSLRSLADARGIWIGTSLDPSYFNDPVASEIVRREFNLARPEVAMKFEVIHPEPGRYDFTRGDQVVEFARSAGLQVIGHTLVWEQQLPEWIHNGRFSRQQWMDILHDHIYTVVSHYQGQVYGWDVVNEAITDDGQLRDGVWLRAIGPEYIALAFQWAHEADPQAVLFYNDNGGEGLNAKSQVIYALLSGLVQAGAPVHGAGLQMHVWINGPPSAEELAQNMERLGALGLEVQITEMDVRLQYSSKSEAEELADQAEMYRRALAVCLQVEACTGLSTWGITDRYSWIPGYTGQPDAPLLFDRSGQPKPAYEALLAELQK